MSGDYHAKTTGEHITAKLITGSIYVEANNVVVEKSEIRGGISNGYSNARYSFTVTDSTVGPTSCGGSIGIGDANFSVIRSYLRNTSEGPHAGAEYGKPVADNVLVQDSFIKLCGTDPEDHSDGFQAFNGGKNVIIRHNTIDQRPVIRDAQTAPVFISDNSLGGIVENNLLAGGSMTIRVNTISGGVYKVTGNRVVNNAWIYGPVASGCNLINPWSDNWLVTIDANYSITSTVGSLACSL